MQTKIAPYELLIRWDEDGVLTGASFATRTVYLDDGAIVFDKIADPVPVGLGGYNGIPLTEVLSPANLDALTAVNRIAAERDTLKAERDAALRQLAEVSAQRDALAARLFPAEPRDVRLATASTTSA